MDLSVSVGSLRLKNPLILASAGYTITQKGLETFIALGYGAVTTKTVTREPREGAPAPRVFWYDPDQKNMLSGAEALRNPGADKMADAVSKARKMAEDNDCKIIGSVAGNDEDELVHVARKLEESGADAIEINMICPSSGPHLGPEYARLGRWWSSSPERVINGIRAVKQSVKAPVWVKCPIDVLTKPGFVDEVDRGAAPDAYDFVGGRTPQLTIDIATGKPRLPGNLLLKIEKGLPVTPSCTGPVKPTTILNAAYMAMITQTPFVCSGGLRAGADIIELIMAGASAGEISTAVYREKEASIRILREIEAAMGQYGYGSLQEIKGKTLQYLPRPPVFLAPGVSADAYMDYLKRKKVKDA